MAVDFTCAHHSAAAYTRGGVTLVGELTPLIFVRWNRVRDEPSQAEVHLPVSECCELLGDLRTVLHELHIFRDGEPVWEGPITRIEYEFDHVKLFAEDVMWVTRRTVLKVGYDHTHPNVGYAIDRVDWLLRNQCFALNGDPWHVVPGLHRLTPAGTGPRTARAVAAYEMYVFEDVDKYAEDYGIDYTVVGRDVYYWDHGTRWLTIPDLDERFLSQFPRIVEYGSQLYTRSYVSNAKGYAGIATAAAKWVTMYGYIDQLITNLDDSGDKGTKLADAKADLALAKEQVVDAENEYNAAQADADAKREAATIADGRADVAEAEADCAAVDADGAEEVARSAHSTANELQNQANNTGNQALADVASVSRREADTAHDQAVQSRDKATCLAEIATAKRTIANTTGLPADDTAADQAEADADAAENAADAAESAAFNADQAADADEAASRATNDPTKQAAANAAWADAATAQTRADQAKAYAQTKRDDAKPVRDAATDAEREASRAESNAESWQTNIVEREQDVDKAQAKVNKLANELAAAITVWADTAQRNLVGHQPAPVAIVVPANTTLLPGSGWEITDLVPGAWFKMTIDRLCRQVSSTLMINEIRVEEKAPTGETVALTAATIGVEEEPQ